MGQFMSRSYNGFKVISSELLTAGAVATKIFANAPIDTQMMLVTVSTGKIILRFDDTADATHGHVYTNNDASDPYEFHIMAEDARNLSVLRGTANDSPVYVTYFKKR